MDLLGNMLRERNRWHFNWLDVCEIEQPGTLHKFRRIDLWIPKRDIDIDVVERATCEFTRNVITDSRSVVQVIKMTRSLDDKHEVVLEVSGLSLDKVRGRCLFIILAVEIDVFGSSSSIAKPVVEGQGTLEDPIIWRDRQEPRQEPVEDYGFPKSDERRSTSQ